MANRSEIEVGVAAAANKGLMDLAALQVSRALLAGAENIPKALNQVANDIVNNAKQLLSTPGAGQVYVRRSVEHTASAPGDPPAVDTGRLRNSVSYNPAHRDGSGWSVEVGTNVEYAPYLEFGTQYMEPRPWLRPAVEQTRDKIGAQLAAKIGDAQASTAMGTSTAPDAGGDSPDA